MRIPHWILQKSLKKCSEVDVSCVFLRYNPLVSEPRLKCLGEQTLLWQSDIKGLIMIKMLVAIIRNDDTENVIQGLTDLGLCVTRIASTGGFFRQGRSTLLVGVEKIKADQAIQVIGEKCLPTVDPLSPRATIFMLNVEHFEQI